MNVLLVLCVLTLAVGCTVPANRATSSNTVPGEALVKTRFPGLLSDATLVVDRLAACAHFAGEFGGDKSMRDRQVTAAIVQLRCGALDADVRNILTKYPGNKELIEALKVASEL